MLLLVLLLADCCAGHGPCEVTCGSACCCYPCTPWISALEFLFCGNMAKCCGNTLWNPSVAYCWPVFRNHGSASIYAVSSVIMTSRYGVCTFSTTFWHRIIHSVSNPNRSITPTLFVGASIVRHQSSNFCVLHSWFCQAADGEDQHSWRTAGLRKVSKLSLFEENCSDHNAGSMIVSKVSL